MVLWTWYWLHGLLWKILPEKKTKKLLDSTKNCANLERLKSPNCSEIFKLKARRKWYRLPVMSCSICRTDRDFQLQIIVFLCLNNSLNKKDSNFRKHYDENNLDADIMQPSWVWVTSKISETKRNMRLNKSILTYLNIKFQIQ